MESWVTVLGMGSPHLGDGVGMVDDHSSDGEYKDGGI